MTSCSGIVRVPVTKATVALWKFSSTGVRMLARVDLEEAEHYR